MRKRIKGKKTENDGKNKMKEKRKFFLIKKRKRKMRKIKKRRGEKKEK